jgi:hypothetical protein
MPDIGLKRALAAALGAGLLGCVVSEPAPVPYAQPHPRAPIHETYVYVTPRDGEYHRAGCRRLQNQGEVPTMRLEKARHDGFRACPICRPA